MADTFVKKPKLIVGTQAQVESEMGANDIGFATDVEFYTAKQIDELLEKSGGASLPILMPMWSDHVINNMSWLRADTFSWQSGDVYVAAYQHLANEFKGGAYISVVGDGKLYRTPSDDVVISGTQYYAWSNDYAFYLTTSGTPQDGDSLYGPDGTDTGVYINSVGVGIKSPQTDTIGDITITYYQAQDGHKICLPDQESNLIALYEKTGAAGYYIIDTTNQRFKLPRRHSQQIVRSVKNADGSWYRLYADGWVEQGGIIAGSTTTVTLPVEMSDSEYPVFISYIENADEANTIVSRISTTSQNTTQFSTRSSGRIRVWQSSGQSAIDVSSFQDGEKYLYFYVGNFEQSAIEQTAGITAETLNGKVDTDLGNITSTGKETVVCWGMPDYSAGVSKSNGTQYTSDKDGFLFVSGFTQSAQVSVIINGINMSIGGRGDAYGGGVSAFIPISKGDIYKFAGNISTITFYPCKGAI